MQRLELFNSILANEMDEVLVFVCLSVVEQWWIFCTFFLSNSSYSGGDLMPAATCVWWPSVLRAGQSVLALMSNVIIDQGRFWKNIQEKICTVFNFSFKGFKMLY